MDSNVHLLQESIKGAKASPLGWLIKQLAKTMPLHSWLKNYTESQSRLVSHRSIGSTCSTELIQIILRL